MADETENVVIKVSETGTDQVTSQLTKLGQAGDQAGAQVAAGMAKADPAVAAFAQRLAQAAAAAQVQASASAALAAAQNTAATATQAATTATAAQTNALQGQAGAASAAANATNASAAANNAAATSAQNHAGQVRNLTSSYNALSEAVRLAAVLFSVDLFRKAIDAATTIDATLVRLTKTTGDYDKVYQSLLKTANATGQSLEGTVSLFNSLTVATQGTKVSHEQLLLAVDSVEKALFLSGVNGEHATRVLRDITEAAAQGTLTSRQLVTILAQAPGVMELITSATGLTTKALLDTSAAHAKASGASKQLTTDLTAEQKVRTANLQDRVKKAQDADLKIYLSATASADQRKKADDKVIASQKAVANEHTITSATIAANEAHNAAAVKATSKVFDDFVTLLANDNGAISKLVEARTLTIAQSFQVLKNDLEAYFVSANKADGVNSKISTGILTIAAAIPVLVPLIVALGAAWLTVQGYLVAETITVGLVTFTTYMVGTVIPAVVAFGIAALTAFGGIPAIIIAVVAALTVLAVQLGLIKNPLDSITALFKSVQTTATQAFNAAIVGANETAKSINQTTAATQGLTAATQQYKDVAGGFISANDSGAHLDFTGPFGGGTSSGQGVAPQQLETTGGDVQVLGGGRSGGAVTLPGSGGPDTRLVSLLASPGEKIIVQTPAQQLQAKALPKFRSGGSLNVSKSDLNDAVTLGLTGITVNYVASGTNSLVGYNAPQPTAAQLSTASAAPDTSASASSAASGAGSATTSFTSPDNNSITAAEAASIAYYEKLSGQDPFGGSDADRFRALQILKRLGDPGGPQEYLYHPFGGGAGKVPVPTWFDAVSLSSDGNVQRDFAVNNGTTYPTIGGFTLKGHDPGLLPVNAKARDGLDFTVPGTGSVDSRVLSLAVSPGEQVSVKTQQQQRDSSGGGNNKTLVQNINIQASDVDSYARSKKQILRDLANKMQGAF